MGKTHARTSQHNISLFGAVGLIALLSITACVRVPKQAVTATLLDQESVRDIISKVDDLRESTLLPPDREQENQPESNISHDHNNNSNDNHDYVRDIITLISTFITGAIIIAWDVWRKRKAGQPIFGENKNDNK